MKATTTFLPSASSPRSVDGPSAMTSPLPTAVAHLHQRTLVDAGVLVRALELAQAVDVHARVAGSRSAVARTTIRCASTWSMTPARRAGSRAESRATLLSMPVPTKRRLGLQQRHRLTLHVRAHQRAVGVVVLEERDQRGGDRDQLLRRHVDQVHVSRGASVYSPDWRVLTRSFSNLPFSSSCALACATVWRISSVADM
jgi:hypothetical protein